LYVQARSGDRQKKENAMRRRKLKKLVQGLSHLIKGWSAPLQAYIYCYTHSNKRLIFDDAETLWQKPAGRVLLRSLCEHRLRKLVQWASTVRTLEKQGVPQQFETSSKIAIVANHFVFGEVLEFEAVADRAHIIYFDPLPGEVHEQVAYWFYDQEIYDFIGERLHLIHKLSARVYTKAYERKTAEQDWRGWIEKVCCHDAPAHIVQQLERDTAYPTVERKVGRFVALTGASRATYYNIKRQLRLTDQLAPRSKVDIPKRRVRGKPPEELSVEAEVQRAREEDARHRRLSDGAEADDDEQQTWSLTEPAPTHQPAGGYKGSSRQPSQSGPPDDDLLAWLRERLAEAARREDYERAAQLQDRINRLRGDAASEGPSD
jgi:hypothetical protein